MNILNIRILTVAFSFAIPAFSFAKTVINGLCYEFNDKNLEATVVPIANDIFSKNEYNTSSIEIPSEVNYDNKTYKVTSIAPNTFHDCENITSISLPNTISFIGSQAFRNCNISTISLPDNIKSIETHVFYECKKLTSITIPEGVTIIKEGAFYDCVSLSSVILPSTITSIIPLAFTHCSALKSVTANSPTPIDIYNGTFEVFGNLYVPKGSKKAYSKAAVWKNFTIIDGTETEKGNDTENNTENGTQTGIISVESAKNEFNTPVYNLSGKRIKALQKGLNIINGKKIVVK